MPARACSVELGWGSVRSYVERADRENQREEAILRLLIILAVTVPPKHSQAWPGTLAYQLTQHWPLKEKEKPKGDIDPTLPNDTWLLHCPPGPCGSVGWSIVSSHTWKG